MEKTSSSLKFLNKKREPLTPEKLRELTGKDYTDEQAEKIIESIRLFAKVLFGLLKQKSQEKEKSKTAEVIHINNKKKTAA